MVYIQSDNERKLPHHFDCACALYGTIENCLDYRLTSYEEVSSGKFDSLIRNNLFVGSVEFLTEVFSRVGITNVRVPKNSNRVSEITTLGEVKQRRESGEILFIKPTQIKLFTGFVFDKYNYTFINDLPDDTELMVYKPFEFDIVTEWRVYVYRNDVKDWKHYSGEITMLPDYGYVTNIIKENKSEFPVAYTIDVGVLSNGENVVIEFNDMWAIGNYGLDNITYLRMLHERYFEIMRR
jgi:hypothetical protein